MLNARQKRFAAEYLIDMNATQAAIRAGYSAKTAYSQGQRLLNNVELKQAIEQGLEKVQGERVADAREVMEYLTSVMRGESKAHVLSLCGDGFQEVIAKPPDERERLKAAELLGKRYAMFNDKINLQGAVPIVISGGDALED